MTALFAFLARAASTPNMQQDRGDDEALCEAAWDEVVLRELGAIGRLAALADVAGHTGHVVVREHAHPSGCPGDSPSHFFDLADRLVT
jgi:hypothetical protein